MLNQPDILEVLGISNREDTFTNIIKYLFDSEIDFREKFSEKFFETDENASLEDFRLLTRTSYIPKLNKRIIPDLILYSQKWNKLSIIEVKIHSGQGDNQLEKYKDNIKTIKKAVSLKEDAEESYYYLSIEDGIGYGNKEWKFVDWKEMDSVFNVKSSRPEIDYIIDGVKDRIASLNSEINFQEVKSHSFNDYLKWNLWESPGKRVKKIINSHPSYSNFLNEFEEVESYTSFAPAANTVETTMIVAKDVWKSELEYTDEKSTINNCYDFHIEIRFSTNSENSNMEIRLDHHLNPYASKTTMENMLGNKKYSIFHNDKKEFLKKMKFNKYRDLGAERKYKYNAARGNYLSIINKQKSIKNNRTVEDVINFISEEIDYLSDQIELFKEELLAFTHSN